MRTISGIRVVACLILLAIPSCVAKPQRAPVASAVVGAHYYVVSHGWHTGMVLPAAIVAKRIPDLAESFAPADFYEFGWGDEGFYRAKRITAGLAFKAMFGSSGTVIHAVGIRGAVVDYFPRSVVYEIPATEEQLDRVADFVAASLARTAGGRVIPLGPGLYGDSQFYRALGTYHLANTCNKWTAKGLASSGQSIGVMFKLSAGSLMRYLDRAGYRRVSR